MRAISLLRIMVLLFVGLALACSEVKKDATVGAAPIDKTRRDSKKSPQAASPEAQAEELKRAEAIALVEVAGDKGSGFFISEDGLLLTTYTLVGKGNCNLKSCPGVKITRGFSKQGSMQVLSKVQLVVADPELNFSLLKVELGKGKSVPYLETTSEHRFEGQNYFSLGHPFGSPLKKREVKIDQENSDISLKLASAVLAGSGGSPILASNGKVIAMTPATYFSAIEKKIQKIFPKANFAKLAVAQLDTERDDIESQGRPWKSFEQALKAVESRNVDIDFGWIFSQPDETEKLSSLEKLWNGRENREVLLSRLLGRLAYAIEVLGYPLSATTAAWVENLENPKGLVELKIKKMLFRVFAGKSSKLAKDQCYSELRSDASIVYVNRLAADACRSRNSDGRRLVQSYFDLVSGLVDENKEYFEEDSNIENILSNAVELIETLHLAKALSLHDKVEFANKTLSKIISFSRSVRTVYSAEGLLLKLKTK